MSKKHKHEDNPSETEAPAEGGTITIQGVKLRVLARYSEGHTLTANEAAALNQTLSENLRNNFASRVKTLKETAEREGEPIPEEVIRKEFEEYAAKYEFGARRAVHVSADPVEKEALKIAKKTVEEKLKLNNIDKKALPEGRFDKLVQELAARDDVRAIAARRVADLASEALSSISIMVPSE